MFKIVFRKELLKNIISFRFSLVLIVTLLLFFANGILFEGEYSERLSGYKDEVEINRLFASFKVSKRPNPLSFWVSSEGRQASTLNISFAGLIQPEKSNIQEYNFTLPRFEKIDWAFIIKVLFSIFAIILTYDAICGEKEKGTLALVCSYSISRGTILLAKFSAALVTLLIPMTVGLLISLLILQQGGMLVLDSKAFGRLGSFILVSIVYISLFVFLSLLVSSLTQRSSIALLLLLSLWVIFIVVIPNLADVVAEPLANIPSEYEFYKKRHNAMYSVREELEKSIKAKGLKPVSEGVASRKMKEEALKIIDETGERVGMLFSEYVNAIRSKQNLTRNLSRISPSATFQYAASAIADSGLLRQRRFFDAARDFYRTYVSAVQSTGREFIRYPWPMWFFPLKVNLNSEKVSISIPSPFILPQKEMPEFKDKRLSITGSLKVGLLDLSLLALFGGSFFLLSYLLFIRYDVR